MSVMLVSSTMMPERLPPAAGFPPFPLTVNVVRVLSGHFFSYHPLKFHLA
jgi:hypothetical protein